LNCWRTGVDLLIPFFVPKYVLVLVFVNQYELSKVFFFPLNWFAEDPTKWPESVVDVGCGIGGSSRYLARKYGAKCQGITLSPVQAQRANALAAAQGLADKVKCEPSGF
jgi:SAM-dependent methyltransferase